MAREWRAIAAVGVATILAGTSTLVAPSTSAADAWMPVRVAGSDRYATAAAVSARWFPAGAPVAYVASGEVFADALAAAPTASRAGAPLLLTGSTTLPGATVAELRRLHPARIVVIGGVAAVSDAVAWGLGYLAPVSRVYGADRYDTSTRLSAATFAPGAPVAFVASGTTFPDALAAGAAAGALGGPVLLVARDQTPTSVTDELARLRPRRVIVVGGTSAVDEAVARRVGATERVGGSDRYETAARLAALLPGSADAFLVSGTTFADALAAGPRAADDAAPLLLTAAACMPTAPAVTLANGMADEVFVIGGTAAVGDAALSACDPIAVALAATTTTTTSSSTTTTSSSTTTTTTGATTTTTTGPPSPPAAPTITATSPAIADDAPDPSVVRVSDDEWYAYTTQSWRNVFWLAQVPVWRSTDQGATWTFVDDAMAELPGWAAWGNTWAPSVTKIGATYVLWYTATDATSGRQCTSWAVSTSPIGPFAGGPTSPAMCQSDLGGSIDADVFTDVDGTRYLYWKSDENALAEPAPSHIWVQRLESDGTALRGSPTVVLAQTAAWESPTLEGPSVVEHASTYYLFYSAGWWESDGYAIGYATAVSPTGPFVKQTVAAPWMSSRDGADGPGGLDVIAGPAGSAWVAYHAWPGTIGYGTGGERATYLSPLGW